MAKRPASKGSPDDSSSFALTDHLPDSAGQELKALRHALESRLVLLEEVLADPSRGESLTGLILDLARVATEEAQAAASQACLATRAEADKEIVALRTSAKAALDAAQASLKSAQTSLAREQASGTDLRRAVDQATLENQKQAALLAAREQLEATLRTDRERIEAEVVRQQSIAADLQRAAGDLQRAASDAQEQLEKERRSSADRESELKAERAAGAQLRQSAESAAARAAALERNLADERSAHEAAVVDLTEARAARDAATADLTNARAARDAAVADLTNARAARDAAVADLTNARAALQTTAADLTAARTARDAAAADLTEAHAARDATAADLARERKAAADRERGEGDLQSQLEFDRAANAQLKQSAESAIARLIILERDLVDEQSAHEAALADLTEARAARDAVVADLVLERKAAADRERAQAHWQSQLEAERATVAELRQASARAEELSATLARETSRDRKPDEKAALLKKSLGEAGEALAAAKAELEAERSTIAALHRAVEQADQQLASARSNEAQAVADHQKAAAQLDAMAREREAITDELTAARTWINELREAEAEFALPPAPPHVDVPHPAAKTQAPALDSRPEMVEPEEGWQAIRLASRYLFTEEVSVQVNGDPARLFDLSVSGCQLLSPTALKPNQAVKIMLPNDKKPVACSGKVVWTRLEPMAPGQPLGYRAGVRFTKPDEAGIETFAARYATR